MRLAISVLIFFCLFSLTIVQPAHAIIFLPAIILIPIAKIVAVIIGGFSFPAMGMASLWSKLFHKSLKRTLCIVGGMLLILALVLILILKIHNPDRPFF